MIYEVRVTNANDESLLMPLANPAQSGFIIKDISGLNPPKSNVNLRENVGISGSIFNSARTPSRNITLTLLFMGADMSPLNTIEKDRLRTYRYFPTESTVKLEIRTDQGWFYIYGIVESNEATIFTDQAGTVISLVCPDPWFSVGQSPIKGQFSNFDPLFFFPFSNPLTPPQLRMGRIKTDEGLTINFEGVFDTGPTFRLYADGGPVINPTISFYNLRDPDDVDQLKIVFTNELPSMVDGDHLLITCEKMNKTVQRYRASTGTYINYIGTVTLDSIFPTLKPGVNQFSYDAVDGAEFIRLTYEYPLRYSGI